MTWSERRNKQTIICLLFYIIPLDIYTDLWYNIKKWGDVMKFCRFNKNNSVHFIIVILFISLGINVYNSIMNSRYKILVGKETYTSLEEVKSRNESNLNILTQCIKVKSINNEELLNLYKNYSTISEEFTNLLSKYKDYGEEEIISISKKSKVSQEFMPNEIYSRIESLIFEYVNIQMNNKEEKLLLTDDTLNNFITMENMSNQLDDYYKDFDDKYFLDMDEEEKRIEKIKKGYWIESLEGMNSIMHPYLNYEFTIKN
jgi:hypothetical protein